MTFNGCLVLDKENILDGWKNYFKDLYTNDHSEDNTRTLDKLNLATLQNKIIEKAADEQE